MITKKIKFKTDYVYYLLLFLIMISFLSVVGMLFNNKSTKNDSKETDTIVKQPYCEYDSTMGFEFGKGGLRIYIPTVNGYINYNIVHSVEESINTDVWRLGQAFAVDDNLKNAYAITPHGAEWDMALMLSGRKDYIGGSAHGDEKHTSLTMMIDGKEVEITSIKDLTSYCQ